MDVESTPTTAIHEVIELEEGEILETPENRIERPLANDHPDGSFSVHLFLYRPKTQNSQIIGQYTHNLLGLKTLSFALLLFIHKNMD